MTLDQPADGALCGTFADADVFGQLSISDLYLRAALFGLGGEPEIDKKADRSAIMPGEIAHKNLNDVGVDCNHSCISQYYSVVEAIASSFSSF